MPFTIALEPEYQEQLLAIVPKFTGAIGMPSCILLMSEVILAHQKGQSGVSNGNPILRSLAFCAFFQCLDALGWFLSTWAVPEDSGFAFAAGTVQSCDFQGFLLQVVIGAPLFSCAMAFYFWLIVYWGKTAQELLVYERFITPIIVIYAFGSSFYMLAKEQYNHIGAVCWVQGSPSGCGNSAYIANPDVPCERGDYAWLYGMCGFYGILWLCIFFILIFNISNYARLREHYDMTEATWFATQSFLYALAFVVTWAPSTTWSGMNWKAEGGNFVVDLLAAFFEPLGGLWNVLIFVRSRPASKRRILRVLCCECFQRSGFDTEEIDADGPPPSAIAAAKRKSEIRNSIKSQNISDMFHDEVSDHNDNDDDDNKDDSPKV